MSTFITEIPIVQQAQEAQDSQKISMSQFQLSSISTLSKSSAMAKEPKDQRRAERLLKRKTQSENPWQHDLGKLDLHEIIRGNLKKANSIVPLGT